MHDCDLSILVKSLEAIEPLLVIAQRTSLNLPMLVAEGKHKWLMSDH